MSDMVHAVSTDRVDDRDKPESRAAEEHRGLFTSGWDEEELSLAFPAHEVAILLQKEGAKYFLILCNLDICLLN